jgi:protein-S-isoprenylcysteine O-methyltransferase Ste14
MGIVLLSTQLILIGLLIWPWSAPVVNWLALIPFFAALVLAIWTLRFNRPGNFNLRPEVKPGAQLVLTGPYAFIRHPMYTSIFLFGIAALLVYPLWSKLACWLLLAVVLHAKAKMEEAALMARFPGYGDYAARVGRFLPRIGSIRTI